MLNKKEFEFLGITKFHEAGYKGQGVIICSKEEVLAGVFNDVFGLNYHEEKDDNTIHATQVMDYIRQVAPDATKWAIKTGGQIVRENRSKSFKEQICRLFIKIYARHINNVVFPKQLGSKRTITKFI